MAREFTANVVARDPETGQTRVFKIGDKVPADMFVGDHAATSSGTTRSVQTPEEAPAGDDNGVENEDGTETTIVTPEYEQDEDEDNELPPYEEWSKTDLRAEVDGRELDVPKKATVAELVEALQADDAANPEAE